MSAAREAVVDEVLDDLQAALPGASFAVVSRSGSIFAGRTPASVNRESFAAMMAVMHGAAETGAVDLGDEFVEVRVHLKKGTVVAKAAGKKMLLVAHAPDSAALDAAAAKMDAAAQRLAELF